MFGKRNINPLQIGKVLNDWVYKSIKEIVFDKKQFAKLGINNPDDLFYELNGTFLFIVIDLISRSEFGGKQNVLDEMHKQNIAMLTKDKYIESNEIIDFRRCLSQTYKETSKIMKKDNWPGELAKDILCRADGESEDKTTVLMLTNQIEGFYKSTVELLKKYKIIR